MHKLYFLLLTLILFTLAKQDRKQSTLAWEQKYIAWEHLKRPGVTEWYHQGNMPSRILLLCQKMNCDISILNVIK